MKKITAAAMAAIMALNINSSIVTAKNYSVENTDGSSDFSTIVGSTEDDKIRIYGKLSDEIVATDAISVSVVYGAMKFKYSTDKINYTWDDEKHEWSAPSALSGEWSVVDDSNQIKVTNHSSMDIDAKLFASPDGGLGCTINNSGDSVTNYPYAKQLTKTLASGQAVGHTSYDTADYFIFSIDITGTPSSDYIKSAQTAGAVGIGTFTLTLTKSGTTSS